MNGRTHARKQALMHVRQAFYNIPTTAFGRWWDIIKVTQKSGHIKGQSSHQVQRRQSVFEFCKIHISIIQFKSNIPSQLFYTL